MNKLDKILEQNTEILKLLKIKNPAKVKIMQEINRKLPKEHYKRASQKGVEARKLSTHLPDRD